MWQSKMELLELVGALFGVYLVYKLIDRLLRLPTVGQYSERYIVITGCDTGFGQAAARRLDKLGCHIFAGCFTEAGQAELSKTCSDRLAPFQLDVTNHDSVLEALDFVKSRLPPGKDLWGLLNNAGIVGGCGPLEWLTTDTYKKTLDVNLFGIMDMTMSFLPLIKKSRGRVVNTGSVAGRAALPMAAPYSVSKYGVEAFSDSLRRSLRPYNCKAVIIEPGIFRTNISSRANVSTNLRQTWDRVPADVKNKFGDEYFNKCAELLTSDFEKMSEPNLDPVIEAYEHALLGRYPRARYVIGLDSTFVWLPIARLPEWIGDGLLELFNRAYPLPAELKNKNVQ